MRKFNHELSTAFSKVSNDFTLPDRYQKLETIDGVTLFITDCIFTVSLLHELWGTKVPSFATTSSLFPSYQQTATGHDGKDLPSTLEDYLSFILVSSSTSRTKFPLVLQLDPTNCFQGLDRSEEMYCAWEELKTELKMLEVKWTANAVERDINDNYCRILPSHLEIAAGY